MLWDPATGELVHVIPPRKGDIVQTSQVGDKLLIGDSAGEFAFVTFKRGKALVKLYGDTKSVAASFSLDGKVLSASIQGSPGHTSFLASDAIVPVDLFNELFGRATPGKIQAVDGNASPVATSASGSLMARVTRKGTLKLYKATLDTAPESILDADGFWVEWMEFTPDDAKVLLGYRDQVYSVEVPKEHWLGEDAGIGASTFALLSERLKECTERAGEVRAARCSGNGSLALLNAEGVIYLWPHSLDKEHVLHHRGRISAIAFSREGTELAVAAGNVVHLWDVISGASTGSFQIAGDEPIKMLAISSTRGILMAGTDAQTRFYVTDTKVAEPLARKAELIPFPTAKPKPPGAAGELPKPEDVVLTTRDHVELRATYWEPLSPGKQIIPAILLHGWNGKRQEYDELAEKLQQAGHAVLSLDLRGHGGSKTVRRPDVREDVVIDSSKFARADLENGMTLDVLAGKTFLLSKHKNGKLNIKLLCVVGADVGALVALNYAAYDWNLVKVPAQRFKAGQDVRALVLLSPLTAFRGISTGPALRTPTVRDSLPAMIIAGEGDTRARRYARELHADLLKFRTPDASGRNLFLETPDTADQGTKLLNDHEDVQTAILRFIELQLRSKSDDIPWAQRE